MRQCVSELRMFKKNNRIGTKITDDGKNAGC